MNICSAVWCFFVCGLKLEIKIFSVFRLEPSESIQFDECCFLFCFAFGPFFSLIVIWTMRCVKKRRKTIIEIQRIHTNSFLSCSFGSNSIHAFAILVRIVFFLLLLFYFIFPSHRVNHMTYILSWEIYSVLRKYFSWNFGFRKNLL